MTCRDREWDFDEVEAEEREERRARHALEVAATDGYGPEGDIIPEKR